MSFIASPASANAAVSARPAAASRSTPVLTRPLPRTAVPETMTALVKPVPRSMAAVQSVMRPPDRRFETLIELFQCEKRSADGAGEMRVGADLQRHAEHFLQRFDHADVSRHAAGDG